jgi:hypothetical protein
MKINLISYLDPMHHFGGGEMIVRRLIQVGKERGHTFQFTTAKRRNYEYDLTSDFDLLVDIFNYPETLKSRGAWVRLNGDLISHVIKKGRFFHMTTAYADVCNLGYLPCSGNQTEFCVHKAPKKISRNLAARDFSRRCFATNPLVQKSFENSIANIYLSPLHRRISERVLNIEEKSKVIIVRPIIDLKKFLQQKPGERH